MYVCLECLLTQDELFRDRRVGPPFCHQAQYLAFPCGEGVEGPRVSRAVDQSGDDRRVDHALALDQTLERVDEQCDIGDAVLEEVTDMLRRIGDEPHGVAERLGYQVDPIARALASGRTGHIGVMCRSLTDVWQQGVAAALGRALLAEGRQSLIIDSSNDSLLEESLAAQLVDQRVDAIIVLPTDPSSEHWAKVAQQTVLSSIGDAIPAADTAAEVVFDNSSAVRGALQILSDTGHRRIAVLTPGEFDTPDRPAEVVARRSADQIGLDLTLHGTSHELDDTKAIAVELMSGDLAPTAFFCLSDSMAYGVYAAARSLGLTVPGDVSVLGSDDNQVSALLTPPLAGYRWPFDDLIP